MKKLFYCAAALAMAFFAGSCQRENLEPVAGGGVTYTIALPEIVQTKGESGYEKYDLYYEVHKDGELLFTGSKLDKESPITVDLELLNDQDYTVLFWANKAGTDYFNTEYLTNVVVKTDGIASNNDDRDAYCAMDQIVNHNGAIAKTVELKRPFAQVNIATLVNEVGYNITPQTSYVKFTNIPVAYNVFTGKPVGENKVVEYGVENNDHVYTTIPDGDITVNEVDYKYVAMNYVLVPEGNIDVYYEIVTNNGTVKNTVNNVPVKPNYRTNIVGNLLTSNATYTVELKPGFQEDGKENTNVLNEGIVKNINGDYEISNAKGLAFAINNLFEEFGGTYYLLNDIDMTGVAYTPAEVPEGVTINMVGEVPAVTRAANNSAYTISGLQHGALIKVNEGTASFTGIKIEGADGDHSAAFIEENKGTAEFVGCEATTQDFINVNSGTVTESDNTLPEGGNIVDKDNGESLTKVGTADELVAALEKGNGVIFTKDIKIEPANMSNAYGTTGINVKNGQTIDGNGYKLDVKGAGGTWDSGINTTGGLIKNLTVTGSFRGIFVNHNSSHSEKVVLRNVIITGTVYTISCDQGLNQGLDAYDSEFYGWTSYAATIGNVKFTGCTFGAGSGYNFSRPYAPTEYVNCTFEKGHEMDPRAAVKFTNCNLNGVALTADNLATLVIANSQNAGLPTVVGTADELVAALEQKLDVFFNDNIKIAPASMSNAYGTTGINVKDGQAIYGNGKTLDIKGAGGTWDSGINTTGGLIKDLKVTGSFRGIFVNHTSEYSEKVVLQNVIITGTVYTISCDQGLNQGLDAYDSEFYGWTSYAKTIGNVNFTRCKFGVGSGYKFCRPYAPTTFVGCDFCEGYTVDPVADVVFEKCTLNGVALTSENITDLVTSTSKVTVK